MRTIALTSLILLVVMGCNNAERKRREEMTPPPDADTRMPAMKVGEEYVLSVPGWVDSESTFRPVSGRNNTEADVRSNPAGYPRFRQYVPAGLSVRVTRVRIENVDGSQAPVVYGRVLGGSNVDQEVRLQQYALYGRMNPQAMQRVGLTSPIRPTPPRPPSTLPSTRPTTRAATLPATRPVR
jgi:hypothetical protein